MGTDIQGDVYLGTSEIDPASPYRGGFAFSEPNKSGSNDNSVKSNLNTRLLLQWFSKISKGHEEDAARLGTAAVDNKFRAIAEGQGICLLAASQPYQEASVLVEENYRLVYVLFALGSQCSYIESLYLFLIIPPERTAKILGIDLHVAKLIHIAALKQSH